MNYSEDMLPFLIPLIALQIILALIALIHVLRHPKYRFGNRIIWIIVVCLIQFIGPILYLTIGKGEE